MSLLPVHLPSSSFNALMQGDSKPALDHLAKLKEQVESYKPPKGPVIDEVIKIRLETALFEAESLYHALEELRDCYLAQGKSRNFISQVHSLTRTDRGDQDDCFEYTKVVMTPAFIEELKAMIA